MNSTDLDLQTSLCMVKIPGITFNDGTSSHTSELNVFQCLYGENNEIKQDHTKWVTFLSIAVKDGYFTLPLTKDIDSRIAENKVMLKDGENTFEITLPHFDDTFFEVLRMYTSLPDTSKANKLVIMDNFGNEQSEICEVSSDLDFQPQENIEYDPETHQVIATNADHMIPENNIMTMGDRVGKGMLTVGGTISNKILNFSQEYKKSHQKGHDVQFSDSTKKYVRTMQNASEKAYKVSNYTVVKKFTKVGNKIGSSIGTKLGQYAPQSVKNIAIETMASLTTVWDGIEQGGKLVIDSTGQAMVDIVEHKYGNDARTVAESFRRTGKYLVLMYFDYRGIGRSAILKTIAKASMTSKK